jgi:DNA polymerase III epsilon subunit-like protein
MKTKHIIFSLLAVFAFASALFFNACKKDVVSEPIAQSTQVSQDDLDASEAKLAHILAFKEKMEYYKENPDLKSEGDEYFPEDATLELEALINLDFCYTDITCNSRTFEVSELIMPLNVYNKINDPGLMEVYYDHVIVKIQAQMNSNNFDNKKLLLVDLEHTGFDANGDAVISITSLIGNEYEPTYIPQPGWLYGELLGTCLDNTGFGEIDASVIIHDDVYAIQFPPPPPGFRYAKSEITTLDEIIPEDHWLVDEEDRDNYEDSKLYIADDDYGIIGDQQLCLTVNNEIPFYTQHCNQLIIDAEDLSDLDCTEFLIEHFHEVDNYNEYEKAWHTLTITIGNVWLVSDYITVQDITSY